MVYIDAYGELYEAQYIPEAYLIKYSTRGMEDKIHIGTDLEALTDALKRNGYSNDSTDIYDNDLNKINW